MTVCFAYVTDERGFNLTSLSVLSLGLSQPRPCHVHIFGHKFVPKPSKEFERASASLGMQVTFASVEDAAAERHKTFDHITTPTLLKLAAVTKLVNDYDRVVYIDFDFLIFEKLNVEGLNFAGRPIAAVADLDLTYASGAQGLDWRDKTALTAAMGQYFNAGMMIFEASAWRDEFLQRYQVALDAHALSCDYVSDCTTPDQCALNMVFNDNWLELPADYNMQAAGKFTKNWQKSVTRHYCGARKFLPLSPLRSDYRDTRQLNAIHALLGRPTTKLSLVYELLFKLNRMRQYRSAKPVRNVLAALSARQDAQAMPGSGLVEAAASVESGHGLSAALPALLDVPMVEGQA